MGPLVTAGQSGSVTHHLLRIQGHRVKHITFGSKFHWVPLLALKYAALISPKDVLVIWRTKNVSGRGLGGGRQGGYGYAFSRIGKGREGLLSSHFF